VGFRLPKTKGMLRREAASWLARLQSGRDPEIGRKLGEWRDADPRHAEAFDRVSRSYELAGLLRQSSAARPEIRQPAVREPRWRPAVAAAAAVAVLVPVGLLLSRGGGLPVAGTGRLTLMTEVGEIERFELADGSRVTLDTASRVEVSIGGPHRSAHLRYGRARFEIAAARQPFLVETPGATASVGHGSIDVEHIGAEGRVEVLAGVAEVRASGAPEASAVALRAGEAMAVDAGGAGRKSAAADAQTDWTRGMLQFEATPLAEAVATANRYSKRHIVLSAELGALRVTGAFRAGDTAGLARALAAAFGLSIQQRAGGDLLLSRRVGRRPK
jgi:transmembrane sensor